MLAHDELGSRVHHAGSPVISKAAPRRQHDCFACRRQLLHRGKAAQKFVIVLNHSRDPRLLQHDLGKPYPVRIGAGAPRKVALVRVVPSENVPSKTAPLRNRKRALIGLPRLHAPQLTRDRKRGMDFLRARCRICGHRQSLPKEFPTGRSVRRKPRDGASNHDS